MSSERVAASDDEAPSGPQPKRQRRQPSMSPGSRRAILKSGIFWDIENIPVRKFQAGRKIPEMKRALLHFVANVNHYDEDDPSDKAVLKFIAVAREKGENSTATTAESVKKHLVENKIELLDLPYKTDPDYCDDAIYDIIRAFTEDHGRCLVVALTGDVGLVRRINSITEDFDLVVVMQRAGKKTSVMQRHCDKIKQTNERGRQQAVYFIDEVIRKCAAGGVPLTFSQLLRLKSFSVSNEELDDNHFELLFGEEDASRSQHNSACDSDDDDESVRSYGSDKSYYDEDSSRLESGLFSDIDTD
ncbi:hypothetical protein BV898_06331 [Hypsibius exemplaris]|uniref:NYN domain-containing protein n=1 Tax=Hypsibius exemplaris TaxID=2072580 RepID=A0A1W0WWJ7_HYPEX|nr:hypothetical protein BV898_06331 [Hypsibius exemplaris]